VEGRVAESAVILRAFEAGMFTRIQKTHPTLIIIPLLTLRTSPLALTLPTTLPTQHTPTYPLIEILTFLTLLRHQQQFNLLLPLLIIPRILLYTL